MPTWPDLEETLTAIFNSSTVGFVQANVDATRTTFINEKDETKRQNLRNRDLITPYWPGPGKSAPVGCDESHIERHDFGSIEVETIGTKPGDRTIIQKLCKEIERVIYVNRFDPPTLPTGAAYSIIRPIQWIRVADYVNYWRYTYEIEAIAYWESRS